MVMLKAVICAAGVFASVVGTAHAQEKYPSKPVTIIVPYAPGGAVDIIARAAGQSLSERLGQPFIIENKPGAGGNVGATIVARSAPDGYTLLMGGPANAAASSLYPDLQYDPIADLRPIIKIGSAPGVLLVSPRTPIKTIAELVEMAKRQPGVLNYGHGGTGTTTEHLASEMFLSQAGIKMMPIPYKGGAAAMSELMGDRLTMVFTNLLNAAPQVKSGQLVALGIASPQRSTVLPDVPTFAEAGYPDMKVSVWWGLMGPSKMPENAVKTINGALNAALAAPELQQRLQNLNATPIGGTPETFARDYAEEARTWAATISKAGIKGP